ncbi:MAG: pyruvate formate lyase family protein [Armatimonadota bacterium]
MTCSLSPRVQRLRDRALSHQWPPSADRGRMVREVFEATADLPRKLQIAHALHAVIEQMPVLIAEDELILGTRTVAGYPEHLEAIDAGSAEPGYMIADYPRALNEGFLAIIDDIERRLPDADKQQEITLQSMMIACDAVIRLAERHAREAEALAARTPDPQRQGELLELARICRKVPALPAETVHEAVQSLWLIHLAIYLECESVAFSLGRMDQYLYPFYRADIDSERLDDERARELLGCLWVKFYENVHGGIGHVQTVTVGGSLPAARDGRRHAEEGRDATNDLSWLIQQVTRELSNVGPSIATRVHRDTPEDYLRYVLETMRLGRYMPQLYNDEQMIPALMAKGIPFDDASEYGLIGCHEPTICGKGYFRSASWPGYVCFQDWLEWALGNGHSLLDAGGAGYHPAPGETVPDDIRPLQCGPETGCATTLTSFERLWQAFLGQMRQQIAERVEQANRGEEIKARLNPRPMMSALIDGCIERGADFTEGGARYNLSGFQAFGLGTCVDSLCAIRRLVYEDEELTLPELVTILRSDWEGEEELRRRVQRFFPHWGNDDPAADELAAKMVKALEEEIARYRNVRGGPFALGLWSFWNHVSHGKTVAASADGRRHGEILSHSMDPATGRGLGGPTAAIKSAASIDTSGLANGGSLLLEFQPRLLADEAGERGVLGLIRTYFSLGGIQLQLSAVTPEQLEAAVREPDQHRDLVVRVAGYCDYFVRQDADRQQYILAREKYGTL